MIVNVCEGGCLHKPVVVAMLLYGLPLCVIVPVADIHLSAHNEKWPCSVHARACVCVCVWIQRCSHDVQTVSQVFQIEFPQRKTCTRQKIDPDPQID